MRRRTPVRIGELWSDFVSGNPTVSRRLCEARIPEAWAKVAGAPVAALTGSLEMRNGVLHVSLTSSVARQEIFMKRQELKIKLNKELGMQVINNVIVK